MVKVPAAIPPDVLEVACLAEKATAEVPAAGDNPVPSAEELAFSHGLLAFTACVAFHVCFHGMRRLQLCFYGVCRLQVFMAYAAFKFVFMAFVAFNFVLWLASFSTPLCLDTRQPGSVFKKLDTRQSVSTLFIRALTPAGVNAHGASSYEPGNRMNVVVCLHGNFQLGPPG